MTANNPTTSGPVDGAAVLTAGELAEIRAELAQVSDALASGEIVDFVPDSARTTYETLCRIMATVEQLQTELADVRRSIYEQFGPRESNFISMCESCLRSSPDHDATKIKHATDCIWDASRQALAASPTAGDAASDSAGEG